MTEGYTDTELELPRTVDGNEKLWATVQRLKRERDIIKAECDEWRRLFIERGIEEGEAKLTATVEHWKNRVHEVERERDQARDALEVARRVWVGLDAALTGFMRKS